MKEKCITLRLISKPPQLETDKNTSQEALDRSDVSVNKGEPWRKIRLLQVVFQDEIHASEIPAFRGAIVEKAGRENIIFHNHLNDSKFLYRYPLIQYKCLNKHAALICIDYAVDEIHNFFGNRDWSIRLSGRELEMKIHRLQLNQFTIQVWDKMFDYHIHNWIALNQENYKQYMQLEGMVERVTYLEKKLIGNIISFAKGINWDVTKEIKLKFRKMDDPHPVLLKGERVMGFSLDFACNVFLPDYIGLGKSVSLGFGVVRHLRSEKTEQNINQDNS